MESTGRTSFPDKVEELLKRIDEMNEERIPISEICRQFVILEWMIDSESGRNDLTDEEAYKLEGLKDRVLSARKEVKATMKDLNSLPMSELVKKEANVTTNTTSHFPFYLQLPGKVVRQQVLSYLTNPQDKLNMMEAIPSEGRLMKWDVNTLRLEMLFKLLVQRGLLNSSDIFKVSMVNGQMRDVVKKMLERSIPGDNWRYPELQENCTPEDVELEELPRYFSNDEEEDLLEMKQFHCNPFICHVSLTVKDEAGVTTGFNKELDLLEKYGRRIWDFKIQLNVWFPLKDQIGLIVSCLDLLPNLRSLKIERRFSYMEVGHDEEGIERARSAIIEANLPLPHLGSLKAFSVVDKAFTPGFGLVTRNLLEKYSEGLWQLETTSAIPITPGENFRLSAPHLVEYKFSLCRIDLDPNLPIDCISIYRDSPLRKVTMVIREYHGAPLVPSLIFHIGKYFGKTLEELDLCTVGRLDWPKEVVPTYSLPSTWMTDVEFPKMMYLNMIDRHTDRDIDRYSFILLFPALHMLLFYKRNTGRYMLGRGSFLSTGILGKLLPNLAWYETGDSESVDDGSRSTMTWKREDCVRIQKNGT